MVFTFEVLPSNIESYEESYHGPFLSVSYIQRLNFRRFKTGVREIGRYIGVIKDCFWRRGVVSEE